MSTPPSRTTDSARSIWRAQSSGETSAQGSAKPSIMTPVGGRVVGRVAAGDPGAGVGDDGHAQRLAQPAQPGGDAPAPALLEGRVVGGEGRIPGPQLVGRGDGVQEQAIRAAALDLAGRGPREPAAPAGFVGVHQVPAPVAEVVASIGRARSSEPGWVGLVGPLADPVVTVQDEDVGPRRPAIGIGSRGSRGRCPSRYWRTTKPSLRAWSASASERGSFWLPSTCPATKSRRAGGSVPGS